MRCCVFKGNYPPLQTGCKSANTSSIDNDIWCQYITTVRIYEIWYILAWKPWRSKQIHCTLSKVTCMFPNYSHPAGEETRPCVPEMSTMPTLWSQSDHYSNQRNYDHQQIQYRQCHDRGHVQVWWLPRENLKKIANHKLKMFYFQWVTEILCQEGIPWLQDIIIVVLMIFLEVKPAEVVVLYSILYFLKKLAETLSWDHFDIGTWNCHTFDNFELAKKIKSQKHLLNVKLYILRLQVVIHPFLLGTSWLCHLTCKRRSRPLKMGG